MNYYISFGNNCAVAYQMEKLGLRQIAFPFDWILTPNLEKIIQLIDNKFQDLFESLEYKRLSGNFPYLNEDQWIEQTSQTQRVINRKYNLTFVHDFRNKDDFSIVLEKYQRRIYRFLNIMSDPNVKKYIFRISHQKENISLLEDCFIRNGFVNYNINYKKYDDMGSSIDWKFDHYKWRDWFDNKV